MTNMSTPNNDSELILSPSSSGQKKPAKESAQFEDLSSNLNASDRKRRQSYPYQHYRKKNGSKSGSSSSVSSTSYRMLTSCGTFIRTVFPVLSWVSYYPVKKYFLYGDLWAGIYIALYLIPQCLAYSSMSGIPAIFSFYTSIIAGLLYAVFGSCRRLSYGVFSLVTAIYLGVIINRLSPPATTRGLQDYVGISAVFTFFVGVFSAGAGLLRVGNLVRYVPYEIMSAFRAGLYLLVFIMQLNSIFGLDKDPKAQADLGNGKSLLMIPLFIRDGLVPYLKVTSNINWNCVGVTVVCMIIIGVFRMVNAFWYRIVGQRGVLIKNIIRLLPVEFIVVSIGFLVHYYSANKVEQYKLPLVSSVGKENESMFDIVHLHFGWPQFRLYFGQMWFECITATLLVLFYTHSLAIDFHVTDTEVKSNRLKGTMKRLINPRRAKYVRLGWAQYSPSRELLTTAGTNIVASFLRCLPVGPSATRSSRMFNVGGRSQIAGLVSSLVLVGLWFGLKNYLPKTPTCIVASVVAFDALLAFFDELLKLKHFFSVSCVDVIIWLLTLASFICLNLELSLYASLALALLVFTYRSKVFSPVRFSQQRNVVTNTNTNLIVPESVLKHSTSKFDLSEDYHNNDQGESSLFSFISPGKMRDIEIFRLEQQYLTVANVDGFVRDVFRRLGAAMKTETPTRLLFDCSSVGYIDWPSVRTVKATILRTLEIAESWKLQPQPLFFFAENNSSEKAKMAESQKSGSNKDGADADEQTIVVAFVFKVKIVQLVHNAGKLNVHFYPTLHRALHHGVKGAIYSILNHGIDESSSTSTSSGESGIIEVSTGSSNSSSNGGNHKEAPISIISAPLPPSPPVPKFHQQQQKPDHNMINIEHHQLQQKSKQPQLQNEQIVFSRKLSEQEMEAEEFSTFMRSPPKQTKKMTKIPRLKLSKKNVASGTSSSASSSKEQSKSSKKKDTLRNVTPLSFRMNDEYEFSSPTSSFGSNVSRRSDRRPPIVRMETFTPPLGVPPPPPPSLSLSQSNLEAFYLSSGPSTSNSPVFGNYYPSSSVTSPPPSPPLPVASGPIEPSQPVMMVEKKTKVGSKSPVSPTSAFPPPPPPPPPPTVPNETFVHSFPGKSPTAGDIASVQLKSKTLPSQIPTDDVIEIDENNEPTSFKQRLEKISVLFRPKSSNSGSNISVNSAPGVPEPSNANVPSKTMPKAQPQTFSIPLAADPNDPNGSNESISIV